MFASFRMHSLSILPHFFLIFLLESGLHHYVTSGQCHLDANKTFSLKTLHFSPQKIFFIIGMTLAIFTALQALKSRKHNRVQHLCICLRRKRKAELFPSLLSVREYCVRDRDAAGFCSFSRQTRGRSRPSRTAVTSKVFSWTHHAALSEFLHNYNTCLFYKLKLINAYIEVN